MRLTASVLFARPPADVFARLAAEAGMPGSPLDAVAVAPGSIYREVMGPSGTKDDLTTEILKWRPDHLMAVRMTTTSPPMVLTLRQTLTPKAGGTQVTVRIDGRFRGAWRLLEPLLFRALRGPLERAIERDLVTVKDELEGRAPAEANGNGPAPVAGGPAVAGAKQPDLPVPSNARHTLVTRLTPEECRQRLTAPKFSWWSPETWLSSTRDPTVAISVSRRGFSLKRHLSAARKWPLVARGRLVQTPAGTEVRIRFGAPAGAYMFLGAWLVIGLIWFAGLLLAWTSPAVSVADAALATVLILPFLAGVPVAYLLDRRRARADAPHLLSFLRRTLDAHDG